MPTATANRIPIFDGLRGYAAVWVMLGHFSTRSNFLIPVLNAPNIAVDIFMIVSGFLMTQHFFLRREIEPWESPRTWLYFYLRRFFRIAPLYYTILIPAFWSFYFLREAESQTLKTLLNIDYHPSVPLDAANILAHVSFLFGLFPNYCTVLAMPDWSISLEMQFYAVFPFLMLLARRINIFRFGLIMVAAWYLSRFFHNAIGSFASQLQVFSLASFLPLQLGIFFVGILLAWLWMEEPRKLTSETWLLLLGMAAIASTAKDQYGTVWTGTILTCVSLLLALLLFYGETPEKPRRTWIVQTMRQFLGNRVSVFLAEVSYGAYLLHLLVMIPILRALCTFPAFVNLPSFMRFLVLTSIAGPITVGLAWVLARFIEQPGIRFGKILVDRLRTGHRQRDLEQLVVSQP